MRISLLGEVTAHADGADGNLLAPLQPMHRLFVAILALDAGHPVGMTRMEEQLWDGDGYVPADPRGRLHTCACRVRSALRSAREAGENVVEATGGGYRLLVPKDAVDVLRFRAKAAQARAQAGRDDDLAASLARDALREWGHEMTRLGGREPLAGLPGRWAENYRTTLHLEHRDLLIELAAAELRRGGAERVLAEFAGLAGADEAGRDDERLAALLMRAYYLCGRQSEALSTYQRTTESLKRKGVEAGRELRMLEKQIRDQDPSLDYPREPMTGPRDLVPAGNAKDRQEEEEAGEPGGGTSDAGESTREPVGPGPQFANDSNSRTSYSQHNFGRTVIANQGTQHVNLGGSDE
jgi:DNA-binding SARP family transcriptional activator